MSSSRFVSLLALLVTTACTTFGGVRSAEVRPGLSAEASISKSGKVGDVSGWFWSDECVYPCNTDVFGVGGRVTYAFPSRSGPALAFSFGVDGLYPHVEGYVQLGRGHVPFGLGARLGFGIDDMPREHGLFARIDVPVGARTRLLLNPALFVHEDEWFGGSDDGPNGAPLNSTTGLFVGFAQGVGLEWDAGNVSLTPALSIIRARARHGGYGEGYGPEWTTFPVASLGVSVGRKRQ
jgi:hypothetical protein